MKEFFLWWIGVQAAGLVATPVAFAFFRRLPDRGYAFAKIMGLLLLGYALWIGATIGIFPNSRGSIILLLILMALVSAGLASRYRQELGTFLRQGWPYILFVEGLFLATFAAAVYLRSFAPEIQWGEKPFELAFLNAIRRDDFFPPQDPWLAGRPISYYYFGYLMMASLSQLTGLGSNVTFYLSLSVVAALAAVAIFGVVYNIIATIRLRSEPALARAPVLIPRAVVFGLVAAGLLLLVSNLEGLFEMLARHGVGPVAAINATEPLGFYGKLGIFNLNGAYDCQAAPGDCTAWYPTRFWWWWKATRIGSAFDIQEFPFFSFHFGDLHPHVIALPFVITAVAIAFQFFRSSDENVDGTWWRRHPWRFLLTALFLGGLAFINLWDLPTFLFLVVVAVFIGNWLRRGSIDFRVLFDTAAFAVPLGLASLLLYTPFYVTFDSGTLSNGVLGTDLVHAAQGYRPGVPLASLITRPLHFLLFWTPLLWVGLSFVVVRIFSRPAPPLRPATLNVSILPWLAPIAIWAFLELVKWGPGHLADELEGRGSNLLTVLMLALFLGLAGFTLAQELLRQQEDEEQRRGYAFGLLLIAMALLLLLAPELFMVNDALGFRANTVFKLWYQAWLFLSVGGAVGLYCLTAQWRVPSLAPGDIFWRRLTLAFLGLGIVYTIVMTLAPFEALRAQWWSALLGLFMAGAAVLAYLFVAAIGGARPLLAWTRISWTAVTALIIGIALIYTVAATFERTGGFENAQRMDGYVNIQFTSPGEYEAIRWLNENVRGTPVILEAMGGDYSEYGRISSHTGLPTLLSWPGHEFQWRGSNQPLGSREMDVARIYTTQDNAEAMRLLRQYNVEYVYVGPIERQTYVTGSLPQEQEDLTRALEKFRQFMNIVFQNDEVTIYRMPREEAAAVLRR